MKKIVCVLLALLLLLSFSACGEKGGDPSSFIIHTDENGNTVSETTEKTTQSSKKNIKLRFPVSVLDEKYRDDIDAFCEEYGLESAKVSSGGTVTVKMSSLSRDLFLTRIGIETLKSIYAVAESGDFPFVKGIKSYDEDNFSEVSVLVVRAKYASSDYAQLMQAAVAQGCIRYQLFAGEEKPTVTVTVIDNKTGETIDTAEYTDSDF